MTTTFEVRRAMFDRLLVGKVYRFNGRRGRVIAKHEAVLPLVTVKWLNTL